MSCRLHRGLKDYTPVSKQNTFLIQLTILLKKTNCDVFTALILFCTCRP